MVGVISMDMVMAGVIVEVRLLVTPTIMGGIVVGTKGMVRIMVEREIVGDLGKIVRIILHPHTLAP